MYFDILLDGFSSAKSIEGEKFTIKVCNQDEHRHNDKRVVHVANVRLKMSAINKNKAIIM